MGRTPEARCAVCDTPVPLASLFTPCGSTKVVCSKCTLKRTPGAAAPRTEQAHSLISRLRGATRAIPINSIVSVPGGAAELCHLLKSGAATTVDGGMYVVPDQYHPDLQHSRSRRP